MSNMWEVTAEDVQLVLMAYNPDATLEEADKILETFTEADFERIENGLSYYCSMSSQTDSSYDDIEDILAEKGIIVVTEKKFLSPSEEDSDSDFESDDEEAEDDLENSLFKDF